MTWQGRGRADRLPKDWPQRRHATFTRDGWQCVWTTNNTRCPYHAPDGTGLQCDHVIRGDDHSLTNLQTLCVPHHKIKTAAEATAARAALPTRTRPPETHPGIVPNRR